MKIRIPGALGFFSALMLRWASGLPVAHVQLPYYYLSYSEGFIRRALIGTFTMPFLVGRPFAEADAIVEELCLGATLALLILLVLLLRDRRLYDPIVISLLASNALLWLARDLGTLDAWMIAAILGATLLIRHGNLAAIAVCGVVPLVHEAGLWLLLPALAGMWVLRPDVRLVTTFGGGLAILAAGGLWFFSTTHFAWPAGMPLLDSEQLAMFVHWQLGQSLRLYVPAMNLQILLFSVLPCAAIVAAAWRQDGPRAALIVTAGVFATWSVALMGLDTERFFAWGPLTAVILATATDGRSSSGSWAA